MHSPVSGSCICPETQSSYQKPVKFEAKWSLHLAFTHVTGCRLADAILEFVVFLTFGARVAVRAEFTFGDAGQAGIVSPVGVEAARAVRPTATLGQETFLSKLI